MFAKILTSKWSNFSRDSVAYNVDGTEVGINTPRFENGSLLLEEGATNILPTGSDNFQTGWANGPGALVTVTPNQSDPFGTTKAYRIQTSGGTFALKYYFQIGTSVASISYSASVILRNRSATPVVVRQFLGGLSQEINTVGQWEAVKIENEIGNGSAAIQIRFEAKNIADSLDFDVLFPMIVEKKFCPSYRPPQITTQSDVFSMPTTVDYREGVVELTWTPRKPAYAITSQAASPRILQLGRYYSKNSLVLWAFFNSSNPGSEPTLTLFLKGGSTTSPWTAQLNIMNSGTGWYSVNQPVNVKIRWTKASIFYVIVNGTAKGPYTIADPLVGWTDNTVWLGSSTTESYANGLYSNVRFSSAGRNVEELKSNSITPDRYTTLYLPLTSDLKGKIPLPAIDQPQIQNTLQVEESDLPNNILRVYSSSSPEKKVRSFKTCRLPNYQVKNLHAIRKAVAYNAMDIELMSGEVIKAYVDVPTETYSPVQLYNTWHSDAKTLDIVLKER